MLTRFKSGLNVYIGLLVFSSIFVFLEENLSVMLSVLLFFLISSSVFDLVLESVRREILQLLYRFKYLYLFHFYFCYEWALALRTTFFHSILFPSVYLCSHSTFLSVFYKGLWNVFFEIYKVICFLFIFSFFLNFFRNLIITVPLFTCFFFRTYPNFFRLNYLVLYF